MSDARLKFVFAFLQTSVTCSEQMTMHLNGKKHLTKEKQHILKMMKGENSDGNNGRFNNVYLSHKGM